MANRQEGGKINRNRSCDSCQKTSAEVFCECTGTRIYLCGRCIGDHTTVKFRNLMHQLIPAEVEISNLKAFRDRNDAFAAGCAELKQNLTNIDQCCQEVSRAFDATIERMVQWRNYYVQELQAWKVTLNAEIAEAEREVKNSLALDEVELRGKYSKLLRHYQPDTLQLFTYQIDTSGIETWAQNVLKLVYAPVPKVEPVAQGLEQSMVEELDSQQIESKRKEAAQLKKQARSNVDNGKHSEAIELYKAADAIYSLCFPNYKDTAINLKDWGDALKNMGKNSEAVTKHAEADAIFSRHFPTDIFAALNLKDWGDALKSMGQNAEAVAKYAAAGFIFSRLFPNNISAAINLNHWGNALKSIEKNAEAVAKYAEADSIFSRYFSSDMLAVLNLKDWGDALRNMRKNADAVTKYAAADAIYSKFFPDSTGSALNLRYWGDVLMNMGEYAEAVKKLATARAIFAVNRESALVRECEDLIAMLS